jgi:hypothetical protein
MITAACILGILILIVALICTAFQASSSFGSYCWHFLICDTIGGLCKALAFLLQAIVEANQE